MAANAGIHNVLANMFVSVVSAFHWSICCFLVRVQLIEKSTLNVI